jgi:hypothetical protein
MNMLILAARDKDTDMPENFGGVEWKDVTNIHPVGLVTLLILGIAILFLPRRWAVLPMIVIACFIPGAQKLTFWGLDFNFLRIMVLFGVSRLFLKREYISFNWQPLDKILIAWVASSTLIYTLQQGNFSGLVNRLGFSFDVMGMYFIFRSLIRNYEDIGCVVSGFILVSIPLAAAFLVENRTGRNMFSVFGGVSEFTAVREGRLRCQGAFAHPILAGCFWASLIPLFAAQWWKDYKAKVWSCIGIIMSLIIITTCASSTPFMGVIAGIGGGLMFYFRRHLRSIRWSFILLLLALHMVMKKPVWHLVSRIDIAGGSTGWHRYFLIDSAIRHFDEWFLLGTKSTAHWGPSMFDITNQYILEGVMGGFLTLIIFILIIVQAFSIIGRAWRLAPVKTYQMACIWSLGVSLFVHCVNFIAVSYFGQIQMIWYLLLAIIGSISNLTPVYSQRLYKVGI